MPLFCFLFSYLLVCFYAEAKIAPEIRELSEAQAKKHLLATVNAAVGEMAARGDVRYDNMVHTIRDANGEVIYLEVDTAMLAGAKAKLVAAVEESLEINDRIKISVPLGSISGWNLFSGIGLPIRVRIHPIGMTEGEIFTELEDCGINQTRHLIQIRIKASLYIVIPGENTRVDTQVTLPLGERVLVGDVPEIYLDTLGVG
ncbi:MAG: sporulation protein YunB [Clostridia bacterium]|nr:sporulation protein YunB [Clostridia bacterium]